MLETLFCPFFEDLLGDVCMSIGNVISYSDVDAPSTSWEGVIPIRNKTLTWQEISFPSSMSEVYKIYLLCQLPLNKKLYKHP